MLNTSLLVGFTDQDGGEGGVLGLAAAMHGAGGGRGLRGAWYLKWACARDCLVVCVSARVALMHMCARSGKRALARAEASDVWHCPYSAAGVACDHVCCRFGLSSREHRARRDVEVGRGQERRSR